MAEKNPNSEMEPSVEGKKKGKLPILLIAALIFVGGGGFFGWTHFKGGGSKASEKPPPPSPPPILAMKPFVVNLQDTGEIPRYLKVEFDLELKPGSDLKEIEARMSELRDAIIILLASKRSDELGSIEGKDRLKDEILARVNSRLAAAFATRVFFKEFIVQ
jgi:flagellar FliL protein